ncbi:hypothetical protein [Aerococcus sp. HMSC10H05]|uniref:hypothetical protein n=1 Tax=Aerococcus sp. HMSC10H05 TaxID=1581084 RepID=UPI0008A4D4B8|nr:hypothetical protein [Aerococcus sp. HMSC10H05]OFU49857.1 hypothetical protein HMPREF3116_06460 [Aerococcus sp. HMSC10H05]
MRKLLKWVLLACIMLLVGNHVEARESSTELGNAVNETLSETTAYKQSTTIEQVTSEPANTETVMSTLSYENTDNFSGTFIKKNTASSNNDTILQVETSNAQSAYKENGGEWQQSLTNDSHLNRLNVLSLNQMHSLLTTLDTIGQWTGSLNNQTVSFSGENVQLTNLLNSFVSQSYNNDANHQIQLVTDRYTNEIRAVEWTISGTSRIDNQAVTTTIEVKLSQL